MAELPGDVRAISSALGASGSALFRTPQPGFVRDDLDQRGDVRGGGRVVDTGAATREDDRGAPVEDALDEDPLARRRRADAVDLDGRSTVTGSPLASRTCSAATLFAP